jgi:hypothetical protein
MHRDRKAKTKRRKSQENECPVASRCCALTQVKETCCGKKRNSPRPKPRHRDDLTRCLLAILTEIGIVSLLPPLSGGTPLSLRFEDGRPQPLSR